MILIFSCYRRQERVFFFFEGRFIILSINDCMVHINIVRDSCSFSFSCHDVGHVRNDDFSFVTGTAEQLVQFFFPLILAVAATRHL